MKPSWFILCALVFWLIAGHVGADAPLCPPPAPNSTSETFDAHATTESLARGYAQCGDYDRAIELYTGLLNRDPASHDVRLGRALVFLWAKRYVEAESDLRQITRASPEYVEAWSALAKAYRWTGDRMSARWAYAQWLAVDPKATEAYLGRASMALEEKNFREAERNLKLAAGVAKPDQKPEVTAARAALTDLHPPREDLDAKVREAQALIRSGDFESARRIAHEVTDKDPTRADAFLMLGNLRHWCGNDRNALEAYERAIRLDPRNADAYLARSRPNEELGHLDAARRDVWRARSLGADAREIRNRLASIERTSTPHQGVASVDYAYVAIGGAKDWHTVTPSVVRRFDWGTLGADATLTSRFGRRDEAFGLSSYLTLFGRSYLSLRGQVAFEAAVLPRVDASGTWFQELGRSWDASAGYRLLVVPNANLHLLNAGVRKAFGNTSVRVEGTAVPFIDKPGVFGGLVLRQLWGGEADLVEFRIGGGREVVVVGTGPVFDTLINVLASARAQWFFSKHLGSHATLSYQWFRDIPNRFGLSLGVDARF